MEKVLFWKTEDEIYDKVPPDWLHNICENLKKFLDTIHPRIEYVKIDRFDVWSMDGTLGKIILPMLVELKRQKQGAPGIDDEDVPEVLRSTSAPEKEKEWDTDANWFLRWEWVLGEEIWAFSQLNNDWEDGYRTGVSDLSFDDNAVGQGPNHTLKIDFDGMKKHQARMTNGFRLFGKYYQGHWD
jgi:hypothetical protein